MKRILFVLHEATRTGSPIALLHFLKWIKQNNPHVTIDVLVLNDGDLSVEFYNLSDNFYDYRQLLKAEKLNLLERLLIKFKVLKKSNPKEKLLSVLNENNYDLIYANSIPSLDIAASLIKQSKSTKLLLHVLELEIVLKMHIDKTDNSLCLVDKFIAASGIVKTNLAENWGVDEEKIEVVYPFSKNPDKTLKKQSKHFIVGASGTVESRKGTDAFLQVARLVNKNIPNANIEFVWVGRNNTDPFILSDIEKMNLSDKVTFTGEQESPYEFFKEFDVFLMTSREEPFGIVCAEAANLKKPIVCFEGVTGIQEILVNGGGYIVPYLDVEQMAEKVMFYYNNKVELVLDGEKAQQLFSEFTPEKGCSLIYDIINNM